MKRVLETAILIMGTLGFWGFVYPELCLLQENYEIVEDGKMANDSEGEIRIKSRVVEYLYEIKEKEDKK